MRLNLARKGLEKSTQVHCHPPPRSACRPTQNTRDLHSRLTAHQQRWVSVLSKVALRNHPAEVNCIEIEQPRRQLMCPKIYSGHQWTGRGAAVEVTTERYATQCQSFDNSECIDLICPIKSEAGRSRVYASRTNPVVQYISSQYSSTPDGQIHHRRRRMNDCRTPQKSLARGVPPDHSPLYLFTLPRLIHR